MISQLLLLAAGALVIPGLAVAARAWEQRQRWRGAVALHLEFPGNVELRHVQQFMVALAGLGRPRGVFGLPVLAAEVRAEGPHLAVELITPPDLAPYCRHQLGLLLPGVRWTEQPARCLPRPSFAVEVGLTSRTKPLTVDHNSSVSILAGLVGLRSGEHVSLQWLLAPARQRGIPQRGAKASAQWIQELKAKTKGGALLWSVGRIGATAASPSRARALMRRTLAGLRAVQAPGVTVRTVPLPPAVVCRRLMRRQVPLITWPAVLNATEAAALLGWPLGTVAVPGLDRRGCRALPPPVSLPQSGALLATSTYPGAPRAIRLPAADRLRGLHVIGPTGSGKSVLLTNLIIQDLRDGHAVIVLDPKGDLVADVLQRVPPQRWDDVIVIDPLDTERPVGFNVLDTHGNPPELVVDNLVGIMARVWAPSWGPRTADLLTHGLLSLVGRSGVTLCDLPRLFLDAAYRRSIIATVDDPVALQPFWGWFDSLSPAEQAHVLGPILNKLRALLRPTLRRLLGQPVGLDLGEVFRAKRVVLVPLSAGTLGEESAAMLGSLFFARLWQAGQARIQLSPERRHPVMVYIDEFQQLINLPTPLGEVLAQARGHGLGLIVAHQHLHQLDSRLRSDVLANARSRVIFTPSRQDAVLLAPELAGAIPPDELQQLARYEVVIQLNVGGKNLPIVTGRTLPATPAAHDGRRLTRHSRQRYGTPLRPVGRVPGQQTGMSRSTRGQSESRAAGDDGGKPVLLPGPAAVNRRRRDRQDGTP